MKRTPPILIALLLLTTGLLAACSQVPRRTGDHETEYVRLLRQEYFKTHPDGQFNEHILRSEIVPGMDLLEVLASWGHPISRRKPSPRQEQWFYREMDEVSKNWVEYKIVFRDNVLTDWWVSRHFAKGGRTVPIDTAKPDALAKGAFVPAPPEKKR